MTGAGTRSLCGPIPMWKRTSRPARKGAAGAYNALVGDFDGSLGSAPLAGS